MAEPVRYGAAALQSFCAQALQAGGAAAEAAALCAESLVAADLRGVHSHGVLRVGVYVDRLRAGAIDGRAQLQTVHDGGVVVVADARAGLGIAMAAAAVDLAVERALGHGLAAVGVRNSNHCGMLAWLARRAAARGCIAIAMSNADAQVAPWGARAKFLGTNPFALAVPAGDPPFVLDFATSVVAHAKIKGAADRGESIPEGWAVDSDGRPTTDPRLALAGALLPFGGPKGSGLSIGIELLAGLLPGGCVGPEIVPLYQRLGEPQKVGHLFIVLNVAAFGSPQQYAARCAEVFERIRALPPAAGAERALLPGEPEHRCEQQYRRAGIRLPADAEAELKRTANLLGLAAPAPLNAPAR